MHICSKKKINKSLIIEWTHLMIGDKNYIFVLSSDNILIRLLDYLAGVFLHIIWWTGPKLIVAFKCYTTNCENRPECSPIILSSVRARALKTKCIKRLSTLLRFLHSDCHEDCLDFTVICVIFLFYLWTKSPAPINDPLSRKLDLRWCIIEVIFWFSV